MSIQQRVVQFGLTEVFTAPQPLVDIVFVHGLNGHPYNTWASHKPSPDVFWPTDLLPSALQDQRCRILTYGYDAQVTAFSDGASKDKIHNHAEHLASRLVANRSVSAAILYVWGTPEPMFTDVPCVDHISHVPHRSLTGSRGAVRSCVSGGLPDAVSLPSEANCRTAQEGTRTSYHICMPLAGWACRQEMLDTLEERPTCEYRTPAKHIRLDVRYSIPRNSTQWQRYCEMGLVTRTDQSCRPTEEVHGFATTPCASLEEQ